MDPWLVSALSLFMGLLPCGIVVARASLMERVVAYEMAGVVTSLGLLLVGEALQQPSFSDLAIALALLSFPASLVLVRFAERGL